MRDLDAGLLGLDTAIEHAQHLAAVGASEPSAEVSAAREVLHYALSHPALGAALARCPPPADVALARNLRRLQRRFDHHGYDRPAAERRRLADIDRALHEATSRFGANVADASQADGAGDLQALVDEDDPARREQLYRLHRRRNADPPWNNLDLVRRILSLRRARARLVGRSHFAELMLEDRTHTTVDALRRWLEELTGRVRPAFDEQSASLLAATQTTVQPWDVAYLAAQQLQQRTHTDETQLRAYFDRDTVVQALLELAQGVFGVSLQRDPLASTWHPDVMAYRVAVDEQERSVAYLDLRPRSDKTLGAWTHGLLDADGRPAAAMTASLGDGPLRHSEVRALFHEFGHLLHHVVGSHRVPGLAGFRVPWDFVEVPSRLMERWAWRDEVLQRFGLPLSMRRGLSAARTFRGASTLMWQLGLAQLDVALHVEYDPDGAEAPDAFARRHLAAFTPVPLLPDDAMLASFTHVFAHPTGYACGYYAYRWADLLAADLFARFESSGVLDPDTGRHLRREVLEPGNHRDPLASVEAFLGRPPRSGPYLREVGVS